MVHILFINNITTEIAYELKPVSYKLPIPVCVTPVHAYIACFGVQVNAGLRFISAFFSDSEWGRRKHGCWGIHKSFLTSF